MGPEEQAFVEWLRDKDRWTFDEADKARELCSSRRRKLDGEFATRICEGLSSEMKDAAVGNGLYEVWKYYDNAKVCLWAKEGSVTGLRRAIGRHNPKAMFRELEDITRFWWLYTGEFAESLKSYGHDSKLLQQEIRAAKKLIVKNKSEMSYKKELGAAKNFAWLEERLSELRWKEAAL